jgi:hypothetical protein
MSARPPHFATPPGLGDCPLDATSAAADLTADGADAGHLALDADGQAAIRQLAADPQALARLVEEHRIFKEAIEKSPIVCTTPRTA